MAGFNISSIYGNISLIENFKDVFSKLLFETVYGIPVISRHSRLEYCSIAAHFLSRIRGFFTKLSFTLLIAKSSSSISANLSLQRPSVFMSDNILTNLFSYSTTIFDSYSLVNLFNALIDISITNLKLDFKIFGLQLKNLKTNQNTSTCYVYKVQRPT